MQASVKCDVPLSRFGAGSTGTRPSGKGIKSVKVSKGFPEQSIKYQKHQDLNINDQKVSQNCGQELGTRWPSRETHISRMSMAPRNPGKEKGQVPSGPPGKRTPRSCVEMFPRAPGIKIHQKGGAVETGCSDLYDVMHCLVNYIILPPSTAPPSDCNPPLMNTHGKRRAGHLWVQVPAQPVLSLDSFRTGSGQPGSSQKCCDSPR